jgi:hypothetical protein
MLFWRILDGFTGWALPTAKVLPCFTVKTQIHLVHGIVDTHAVLIYTFALKYCRSFDSIGSKMGRVLVKDFKLQSAVQSGSFLFIAPWHLSRWEKLALADLIRVF